MPGNNLAMTVVKIVSHFLKLQRWMPGGAVIMGICVSLSWSSNAMLQAIVPPGAPVINKKQISYTIKFVFDHCPKRYWSYPDIERKMVTIEIYDSEIKVSDSMKLQIVSPLKAIEVKNSPTSLVLSGKKTLILVTLKEEMNSELTGSGNTLILNIWKNMPSRKKASRKKRRSPIIPLAIVLACAGLTALFISSITTEN